MSNNEFFKFKTGFTGGTELMAQLFHERVGPYLPLAEKFNCILLPGVISLPSYHSLLEQDKDIVLWLHNNPNEFLPPVDLNFFRNAEFHKKLRCVITVSDYAKKQLVEQSGISSDKVVTIYNAVDEIPLNLNKHKDTLIPRLIYVSQPERGLLVALRALHQRTEEFTFDIYGDVPDEFLMTLPRNVHTDARFIFHGRRPHEEVLAAISDSHIFVYPATWYETFCVSLVEAVVAECIAVYNSIGSLKEVGMGYGITYLHENLHDMDGHILKLNNALDKAFRLLTSSRFDPSIQRQEVSHRYSHENFVISWFNLASKLMASSN